ncbi:MAG: hypothetical protein ACI4KR_09210 [Ruminiclostridium sp.]
MTSKEYFKVLEEELAKIRFHAKDISFGDTYFIGYHGDNSICHFRIKELPGWNFGIWFTYPDIDVKDSPITGLQFFVRHKDDMDKFKPSRSNLLIEDDHIDTDIKAEDVYYQHSTLQIKNMCTLMKCHPVLSYLISYYTNYYHYPGIKGLLEYFSLRAGAKKRAVKDYIKNRMKYNPTYISLLIMKKRLLKFPDVVSVKIDDKNDDDWTTIPRYDLKITIREKSIDGKVPAYIIYKASGKRRSLDFHTLYYCKGDNHPFYFDANRECYYDMYGWRAKLFGRKKYIDKIPE